MIPTHLFIQMKNKEIHETIEAFMKKEDPLSTLVESEPFLKNPFNFYSSHITQSLNDRENVVRSELINYYKSIIKELQQRLFTREKEIKASSEMNNYYISQINEMSGRIKELNANISDLK